MNYSSGRGQCGHLQPVMSGLSMPCLYAYARQAIWRFRKFSFACPPMFWSLGTRSIASIAKLKRSISLLIASSIGVLILPFSLYPRTCSDLLLRPYVKRWIEPGVTVEIEDDGFVRREQRVEIAIRQPVRVFAARLQLKEVDDINEPNLETRKLLT